MVMRPSDDGRFRSFWPSQQVETFNIMIPSSLKLNSDDFHFLGPPFGGLEAGKSWERVENCQNHL